MRYLILIATALFIFLATTVKTTLYFSLDLAIAKMVQAINLPYFGQLMTALSNSGWGIQANLIIGSIIVSLLLLRKKLASLFIIFISLLDTLLFYSTANLINRPRPTPDLIRVDWKITVGGFPSGHVLMYTLIFGFLAYLSHKYIGNRYLKWGFVSFFIFLIIIIGVARIYSGQHWPSDILGGYLIGGIGLSVVIYFFRLVSDLKGFSFPMRDHPPQENRL